VIGLCNAILTVKRWEPLEASTPEGDAKS